MFVTKQLARQKVSNSGKEKKDGGDIDNGSKEESSEEKGREEKEVTPRKKNKAPPKAGLFYCPNACPRSSGNPA
jgi:hypothetical protein